MSLISLEYEQMLDPIPGASPAGESLRYDPVYDRIAHARTQEPTLSQGVWKRETQQADWALVEELSGDALVNRSKDLQLAVWLTEAWLHRDQLPGLARGCTLIAELHRLYPFELIPSVEGGPETALPLPDNPAVEHRLNMIQWMNERFSLQLKLFPLTAPPEGMDLAPVSLADLEASLHAQQAARKAGNAEDTAYDGNLVRGLKATSAAFITRLWTDSGEAAEAVDHLEEVLDLVYGSANGGLLRIREVLRQMRLAVEPAVERATPASAIQPPVPAIAPLSISLQETLDTGEEETGQEGALRLPTASVPTFTVADPAGIQTREQAYEMLADIANFLAQLEPHSPVPYLLRRAIAWGGMSLMELLPELLQDQAALKDVGHLLRISAEGSNNTFK